MPINPRHRDTSFFIYGIILFVLLPQLFMSVRMAPDSISYIQMWSTRPPLLPLLLKLDTFLFSSHFYFFHTVQITLISYAMITLDRWMRQRFSMTPWLSAFAILLFLIPTYVFFSAGRYVLSEAFTFPLFALLLIYFFDLFLDRTIKAAIGFSVLTALLVLTRDQFYCLYGIMPIAVAWLLYYQVKRKVLMKVILLFLSTVLFVALTSRTYQYILHHHFNTTTSKSVLLLVQPLFLADENDALSFTEKPVREAFSAIYQSTHRAGFLLNNAPNLSFSRHNLPLIYAHFYRYFDPIQQTAYNTLSKTINNDHAINALMNQITVGLFQQHWKKKYHFLSLEASLLFWWAVFFSLMAASRNDCLNKMGNR